MIHFSAIVQPILQPVTRLPDSVLVSPDMVVSVVTSGVASESTKTLGDHNVPTIVLVSMERKMLSVALSARYDVCLPAHLFLRLSLRNLCFTFLFG